MEAEAELSADGESVAKSEAAISSGHEQPGGIIGAGPVGGAGRPAAVPVAERSGLEVQGSCAAVQQNAMGELPGHADDAAYSAPPAGKETRLSGVTPGAIWFRGV